ncbi:MAG: multicopper oxidase domain-containing protein [Desulfobacteraceae bacterium]|nr:multicopper oxidase domain-containing protein [Desulfobacteraceae bacterium]
MNMAQKILGIAVAAAILASVPLVASARIEGLTGPANPTFNFATGESHVITGEGNSLLVWCFADLDNPGNKLKGVPQYPGPTLIVNEGDRVTIKLANTLSEPVSMVFPGLDVETPTSPIFSHGAKGNLTSIVPEAAPGGSQTYVFRASRPGTFYYQSGSNQDVQLRMGLYGAIIVRPTQTTTKTYTSVFPGHADQAGADPGPAGPAKVFTKFAYNEANVPDTISVGTPPVAISNIGASTAYDREFLYLCSDMDPYFNAWMEFGRDKTRSPASYGDWIVNTATQKKDFTTWKANYWFINGRNAPDTMGTDYDPNLPNQPYTINVLFHPGEMALTRFLNLGRDLHPIHTHGNHQRIVAEDGLILSSAPVSPGEPAYATQTALTGADISVEEFTLTMSAGNTFDSIFNWTGKGLGWDAYGHKPGATLLPYEYIADHVTNGPATTLGPQFAQYGRYDNNQFVPPLADGTVNLAAAQAAPTIAAPDPLVLTFGQWFSGSQYLGSSEPLPPTEVNLNLGGSSYYFMWHSHAEREIVNFNTFPGGMLTMAGIIPWSFNLPAE